VDDFVVVYRGFSLPALELVEAMLRAEGLAPRRRGKASPALLGMGDYSVEQLIEVPREHEPAARALIASSANAPAQTDELEAQALSARPAASGAMADERGGFDRTVIAAIVLVAVAVLLWLNACGGDAGRLLS
jgi:hypothetical protein